MILLICWASTAGVMFGARGHRHWNTPPILFNLFCLGLLCAAVAVDTMETDVLMRFKEKLSNNAALGNWNSSGTPCSSSGSNWVGVLCSNGSIWGLQLEHMELSGTIDLDSLTRLPHFRTISLMNNRFQGPLPDMKKLGKLKSIYLSNNLFSGEMPDDAFEGMRSLKRLFVANNQFTGNIPRSIASLPKLMELRLEGNHFRGQIPEFHQSGLKNVNFARNELEGQIPAGLSELNPSSFSGNKNLCGKPLDPCNSISSPSVIPEKKSNILMIIIIVIVVGATLGVVGMAFILFFLKRRTSCLGKIGSFDNSSNKVVPSHVEHTNSSASESNMCSKRTDRKTLTFLTDDIKKFDLQDLLTSSAEVLGSGTFTSSYKVSVSGQALVVKRYRNMSNVGREEFNEHMRRLARLKHPNLLSPVAYYYRKEEKLFVSKFVSNGSLARQLHGNRSLDAEVLDWPKRLKIIKGIARGLAFLYKELPMVVPHGHLKSSNVLLDDSFEPLLADYALRPVINTEEAHATLMAYKTPEYARLGNTYKKSDIWNFGIVILEILTGKFPENYLTGSYEKNADLAIWVNEMVKKNQMYDIFDKDLTQKNNRGEMFDLLQIGLCCCEEEMDRRQDIITTLSMIEKLTDDGTPDKYSINGRNLSIVCGKEGHFSTVDDR